MSFSYINKINNSKATTNLLVAMMCFAIFGGTVLSTYYSCFVNQYNWVEINEIQEEETEQNAKNTNWEGYWNFVEFALIKQSEAKTRILIGNSN